MRKFCAPFLILGVASVAGEAAGAPPPPPYVRVITQPLIVPMDGVLAVGTVDARLGVTTTEVLLDSVLDAAQVQVAGENTELTVRLGPNTDSETQLISLWKPDAAFRMGSYTATGASGMGGAQVTSFEVVEDGSAESPELTLSLQTLRALKLPARQLPCGTTVGTSRLMNVSLTTEYRLQPSVAVEFEVTASDARLSQYFARATQPGVNGNYAPLLVNDGKWRFSSEYAAPLAQYCVVVSLLSLGTGATVELEPACVADDGTDWSAIVPATAEETDAQLRTCSDPPIEYKARYCALLRVVEPVRPGCEAYSSAELDAALAAPLPSASGDVGPTPGPSASVSASSAVASSTAPPTASSAPPAVSDALPTASIAVPALSVSATSVGTAPSSSVAPSLPAATTSAVSSAGDPPVNGVSTDSGGGCSVGKPASAPAWRGVAGWLLLGCCARLRGRRRKSPRA